MEPWLPKAAGPPTTPGDARRIPTHLRHSSPEADVQKADICKPPDV